MRNFSYIALQGYNINPNSVDAWTDVMTVVIPVGDNDTRKEYHFNVFIKGAKLTFKFDKYDYAYNAQISVSREVRLAQAS